VTSPGEDFIELGLLFIVTGLTVVLVVAILELLILRGSDVQPAWLVYTFGGAAVLGLGFVVFRLVRRLLWFLNRMK
jgi:hypothetical protein